MNDFMSNNNHKWYDHIICYPNWATFENGRGNYQYYAKLRGRTHVVILGGK